MVKILGTARNAGLVLLSALVMGEEVTAQQAAGYALCLGFFGAYNYYKMTEKHVPVSHAKEEIMPLKADVEVGK